MSITARELPVVELPQGEDQVRVPTQRAHEAQDQIITAAHELGSVAALHTTGFVDRATGLPRLQHNGLIKVNNENHAVVIIDALAPQGLPADNNVVFVNPGLTESPHHGSALNLLHRFAEAYPGSTIAGIGTLGIGRDSQPLSWSKRISLTIGQRAQTNLEMMAIIAGRQTATFEGTSMSAQLGAAVAAKNLELKAVNIQSFAFLAPAILRARRVLPDMVARFPRHCPVDIAKVLLQHEADDLDSAILPEVLALRSLVTYVGNIKELLRGVPEANIQALVNNYNVGVVAGSADPLAQLKMWHSLQAEHPTHVYLETEDGAGHGLAMSRRGSKAIVAMTRQLNRMSMPSPK